MVPGARERAYVICGLTGGIGRRKVRRVQALCEEKGPYVQCNGY